MLLAATTSALEIKLAGAVAANEAVTAATFADMTTSAHTPGTQQGASTGATAATIVAAPAASTQRKITTLSVYNADTADITALVQRNDNGTLTQLVKCTIAAGYTLFYSDVDGWRLGVTAAQGAAGADGSDGADGADGDDGAPGTSLSGVNAQTGTTYTLVLGDAGGLVTCSNASAITVTIPPASSVSWAAGTIVYVEQAGAGQVTVAAGSGVTLHGAGGLKTRAQYSVVGLLRIASDSWLCVGDAAT
jgi:hypothetical protein